MAKKAKPAASNGTAPQGETVSAYFRKIFAENPKLLDSRSNDELVTRWLADHPGQTEMPKNVKSNLSNLKSVLRSTGRKKAKKAAKAAIAAGTTPAMVPTVPTSKLEKLEELIDDCMTFAKTLDREGLADVIQILRKARYTVVWKIGS